MRLMMNEPILSVRNLRIERGDTVILDGISWRVERGQHWVILGANANGTFHPLLKRL